MYWGARFGRVPKLPKMLRELPEHFSLFSNKEICIGEHGLGELPNFRKCPGSSRNTFPYFPKRKYVLGSTVWGSSQNAPGLRMVNFQYTFLLKMSILSLHEAQAPNGQFQTKMAPLSTGGLGCSQGSLQVLKAEVLKHPPPL